MRPAKQLLIVVFLLLGTQLFAQQTYTMASNSVVTIYGTSNVHDWSEHCERISGKIIINEVEGQLDIDFLRFEVEVDQIRSGKSTMNEYTYDALQRKAHPTITFKAQTINTTPTKHAYTVTAEGVMTIAGKSNTETVIAECKRHEAGFTCSGEKSIDMTRYGVEPPSVMFGAMTVGKMVDIRYDILLTNPISSF